MCNKLAQQNLLQKVEATSFCNKKTFHTSLLSVGGNMHNKWAQLAVQHFCMIIWTRLLHVLLDHNWVKCSSTHLDVLELLGVHTDISGSSAHSGPGFIGLRNVTRSRAVTSTHVPWREQKLFIKTLKFEVWLLTKVNSKVISGQQLWARKLVKQSANLQMFDDQCSIPHKI